MNNILEDLGKMLRRLIGEDIDLTILPDPQLRRVKADIGQVEQVVMNLIVNARDAMPKGGVLTITTRNVDIGEISLAADESVCPGPYVLLSISDTGCGMTAETKSHIFEPFFSTKGEKGTGLGLATVFGIVKQSGGYIQVDSELGHGATFSIYLPVDQTPLPTGKSHPRPRSLVSGTETILLAEDEDGVRHLACMILQNEGYKVLEARGGKEAMMLAANHDGTIHVLVTDVVMPNMSGRQLAERLQLTRPEMKVLYVSGYTDEAIAQHGTLDPDTPFLQKPYTLDAMIRKLREVLTSDGPS